MSSNPSSARGTWPSLGIGCPVRLFAVSVPRPQATLAAHRPRSPTSACKSSRGPRFARAAISDGYCLLDQISRGRREKHRGHRWQLGRSFCRQRLSSSKYTHFTVHTRYLQRAPRNWQKLPFKRCFSSSSDATDELYAVYLHT